jgi:diguanylate cyclase (GGDEF)-like protein
MTAVEQEQGERAIVGPAPLFVLSFRHRDELMRIAEAGGWLPIAARRIAGAEARFITSGAQVVIVDARDAIEDGLEAVRALGDAVEANAGSLMVLLSRADASRLRECFDGGATHFLMEPFDDFDLGHAIQFAERNAQRAGAAAVRRRTSPGGGDGASWRWRPGSQTVELSPTLARKAGFAGRKGTRVPLMELLRRLDADGRRAARIAIDRLLSTGEATAFAHQDPAGDARLAHHLRVEGAGEVIGRTETIASSEQDAEQQHRDPLTGVRDGVAARSWLQRQLDADGEHPLVVVLLVAASRFDAINAAFGRATGDAVLQAAARRIERLVDADNHRRLVARIAGAQFGVLLAAPTSLNEGRFLAGQLVDAIARPFVSGDHVITLGSRVGVVASSPGDDAAALLRRASIALVEAKSGESGPIRVLEQGAQHESARGDQLEIDLRRALDSDEIEIVFQPQVAVTGASIVGVEALARWRHPEFGELGATTLFSVAERSDYVAQLSDHIQRKAIEAAAGWGQALSRLRLSVNITAADIVRPNFASQFLKLVEETGFAPERLTVEVTESGLIEDLKAAANLLARLREGGLRIAIDDFGTGYSSLAYLKALPLDYLKIDKRLCEDITGSPRDRIVVRSVIDMARSLGLAVIAEGVETQEQLDLLAQEGCNLYQGFLCSPPIDSVALEELVAGR